MFIWNKKAATNKNFTKSTADLGLEMQEASFLFSLM